MRRRRAGAGALAVSVAVGLALVAASTDEVEARQVPPDPVVQPGARHAAVGELPEPAADPEAVRDDADDILSQPKFKEPPKSWLQRFSEWFSEKLVELTRRAGSGGVLDAVGWFLVLASIGVIVFFVLRIGRTVRPDPGVELEVLVEPHRDPDEWRRLAEQCEARGEWKEALRCRYRVLIGELVERGVVRDIPGRTAGEYRRDLARAEPEAAAPFAGASDLFERAWYGDLPTGPEENRRFRRLADEVLAGTRR